LKRYNKKNQINHENDQHAKSAPFLTRKCLCRPNTHSLSQKLDFRLK